MGEAQLKFTVPSLAVPSLLGIQGSKIKDMQDKTNMRIYFKEAENYIHNVFVFGPPAKCALAFRMVMHGINHNKSSLTSTTTAPANGNRALDTLLDLSTILSELYMNKC